MKFLGIKLWDNSLSDLANFIISNTNQKRAYYAINPDCILKYLEDKQYNKILKDRNSIVYADGMGIIFTQKFLKLKVAKERIATTDLFPEILKNLSKSQTDRKIFLYGGSEGTAKKVIVNMNKKYKNLNFVGEQHGYIDTEDQAKLVARINSLDVDILFVGLGCPIQEKWVYSNLHLLNVNNIITCGGLFDYYANNVKRAPLFVQKLGLEWLFRLLQEPKRLYKRYIFGNLKYILYMMRYKLKGGQ